MSTIDEAVEFFRSFFDAECKALEASLSGATSFEKLHAKMQAMLVDETVYEIQKVDVSKLSGDWLAANEATRKALAPRQLFLVEQHELGKQRRFGAIASPPQARRVMGYEKKFWADDSLRMISTYVVCATCDGLGAVVTVRSAATARGVVGGTRRVRT